MLMVWIESTEGGRVEKVWKRNLHAPLTKRMFVSSLHRACYLTDCSFSFIGGWETCSSYRRRGKLIVTFASIRRPWQDLGMRGWLPNLTVDTCDNRPEKVPDSLSFKHVPMKIEMSRAAFRCSCVEWQEIPFRFDSLLSRCDGSLLLLFI